MSHVLCVVLEIACEMSDVPRVFLRSVHSYHSKNGSGLPVITFLVCMSIPKCDVWQNGSGVPVVIFLVCVSTPKCDVWPWGGW